MKIEIEADDLFSLKKKIEEQAIQISSLEGELYTLNPHKVEEQARRRAYNLFENYLIAVFKSLGFEDSNRVLDFDCDFWRNVKNGDWTEVENIKVNVGARIEKEFRQAYLRIGIKME